jgi:hypothetical protein
MTKRIQVAVDEDLISILTELSELRGETISKIAGDVLDTYRAAWALELAKWRVARRKETEVQNEIEDLYAQAPTRMAMLPNEHHPGPRCSCRNCLRQFSDGAG